MEKTKSNGVEELARELIRVCSEKGITVACAESCTGGLIGKLITDIPGSSAVFAGGYITYNNAVKVGVLGVDPAIIRLHTEVSAACAEAMAYRARTALGTTLAVSATGFAGPDGGSGTDPVGTVYLGVSTPSGTFVKRVSASPSLSRKQIRKRAARRALSLLLGAAESF